ncbi:prepilin-type N-terminal cleavage/methylation domain-containing protein [Leptolyngbya iicbica]
MIQRCSSWAKQRLLVRSPAGLTLIEALVVVVMIGILAAIATPSWLQYQLNQEVKAGRDELRQAILQAQNNAITHREAWRFSLRQVDNRLEWAIHPNSIDSQNALGWNVLSPKLMLDNADTTLRSRNGIRYVRFGFQGEVECCLGTVTLDSKNGAARNQCVVISTLIGATRNGNEHSVPNDSDRYCY